jgi:hypothetical protein
LNQLILNCIELEFFVVECNDQLQVWVNLGSVHLACNEPDEAARMYSAALSKFYNNKDAKILLWLARAQYDLKRIGAAKHTLLKAMHICPWDFSLLFNTALTMQQFASSVCSQPLHALAYPCMPCSCFLC